MEDMLMNVVAPFWGLCYANKSTKSNNLSRLVCPPYNMISAEQKEQLKSRHEFNAVNLEFPSSYDDAKQKLEEWIEGEVLTFSNSPSLYVYEISYKINDQTYQMHGIIGGLKLPGPKEDYILNSKNDFQANQTASMKLLEATKCQFSPVCVLYEDNERKIFDLIFEITSSTYLAKAKQEGRTHKIWEVSDESKISEIVELFSKKTFYISGGDQIFRTACSYKEKLKLEENISDEHPANYVMTLFIEKDDPALAVLPIHRIVSNIDMFDSDDILQRASKYFEISTCKTLKSARKTMFGLKREDKTAFGIYADGIYSVLVLKDLDIMEKICKQSEAYRKLDVAVLHKLFLEKILNVASDQVGYVQSASEACEAVDCGDACFAVFLSATRINEIIDVVKNGEDMPQESALFFPEPMSGFVFYSLDHKI